MKRNTQRRALIAASAVLAGSLALTGCNLIELPPDPGANMQQVQDQDDAAGVDAPAVTAVLPDGWPATVPAYAEGRLVNGIGDPSAGFFTAIYEATTAPVETFDAYAATLVAGALTQGETTKDDTSASAEFTGDGIVVYVATSMDPGGQVTVLDITIQEAS